MARLLIGVADGDTRAARHRAPDQEEATVLTVGVPTGPVTDSRVRYHGHGGEAAALPLPVA